jgi:PAS domain S-box-containing protein
MGNGSVNHKALFDQMPVPRFLVEKSGAGFVVRVANDKAIKHFESDCKNIIGATIEDLFTKKNAALINESLKVSMSKKMAVTVPPLPNFPGDAFVPGLWVNPIFDGDRVLWLDVIAQPSATDTSIVQRERDDAFLLLSSIFDVSEVGLLVFDRKRRIVKVNDSFERIFGWNRHDTLSKDFIEFVVPEEHVMAQDNYEAYLEAGTRNTGDVKILCKDGSIANALYTTARLDLSHGRRFQVTTLVDVTAQKQLEQSLRIAKEQADAANRAKSAFLANMSHELRTPLNAIIGFSEMMVNETFGPLGSEKYNEYCGDVNMSAKHLLEIINEVLDMSKIEAGRVELDEQPIDLSELIISIKRITDSRMLESNLIIQDKIQEGLPALKGDPRLIRQILINLTANAVKFSNKEGIILIQAKADKQGRVMLRVSDQGVGIPADKIEEAMKPFGQIHDPSQASIYQGTGLGLPLAKAMAELHGADFKLESEEKKGTRVTITFPKSRSLTVEQDAATG